MRRIAAQAGALLLRYAEQGVTAEDKSDDSPVTIADKESEKLIVSALTKEFPDDGLLGEEGANIVSKNGRKWIIDPLDGTRDFVRGNGLWAVLMALEVDGETHLGKEKSDERRTAWIEKQGIKVMRFWNTQVFDELESVLEAIFRECDARKGMRFTQHKSGERG